MSDFFEFDLADKDRPRISYEDKIKALGPKVHKLIGKAMWTEEEEERCKERMASDPKIQAFFEQYHNRTAEHLIKTYISHRRSIIESEEDRLKNDLFYAITGSKKAEGYFWQIQQKKLFEAQCLWRAGRLDIPQIKTTMDFTYWGDAIKFCKFIEPVQPDEVELLKRFLLEKGYELDVEIQSEYFQAYDFLKRLSNGEEYMPAFYQFWDQEKGTGYLFNLPDVRSGIETTYRELGSAELDAKLREEMLRRADPDKRPIVNFFDGDVAMTLIDLLGDKEFKKIFIKFVENSDKFHETVDFDFGDIDELSKGMPMHYPLITPYTSWRKNVGATISKYRHEVYTSELDSIYEIYCMQLEMDINPEVEIEEVDRIEQSKGVAEAVRRFVLKGRELSGEPADWSFL